MKTLGRLSVALVIASLLAACGSSGSGVSEPAGKVLALEVVAIRNAAGTADRAATAQQLAQLRASVSQLRASDDLSAGAAARIRRAADGVEAQLQLLPAPTTTTSTTTTTAPAKPGRGNGEGHGNNGKGKEN